MIDIGRLAANLECVGDGQWHCRSASVVSYPSHGNCDCYQIEEDSFWFKHRNACLADAVSAFPPSGPIFDIGGGNGFVSLALQQAGFQTVIVEPGAEGARNAYDRGIRPVIRATLEDAHFYDHSLPAIGTFDVLEHVEDDVGLLRQIRRVLVTGGMLYLTVSAYRFLWSADDETAGHFRRYTLGRLVETVRSTGFEIRFATYLFSWLPIPILFARTIPNKLGIRRSYDAGRQRKQHQMSGGLLSRVTRRVLYAERERLRRQKRIPFGSSCLVVAAANRGGAIADLGQE